MNPVQYSAQQPVNKDVLVPSGFLDCSVALHSFSDPTVFIDFALDSVLALTDAYEGSFFVWDEYSKELILKAVRGRRQSHIQDARIKLREGIGGWAAEKGMPLLVNDLRSDSRFIELKKHFQYSSFSFLVLPLISGNKLLGLINLTEKENRTPFNEADLERTRAFARHAAIALDNIRTENRLRKEVDDLNHAVLQLKQTMKEQETLASVGKLVSHLAHELTNPIDAIRRFVNLALDQVAQDSLAREYLVKAKRGIRRSIGVIRGLLELSNTNGKKRARKTNLHDIIDDAISSILQDSSFERITIQKDYSLKPLMVEDLGLKTVLLNLFQNAHHAMNGEGAISVATKEEGKQIMVTVCDSGCGVSESVGAKIFDAFFTTKENGKGTGIGLAICREIVRKSGGEISFESRENEGTTFKIVLPSQT